MAKPITKEKIKQVLDPGGYFSSNREITSMDPIEPTPMKLKIVDVKPYDRNPRRTRNPEYDAILASVRAKGQEEVFPISRRPNEDHFILRRGFKTRYEIMRMLYEETGDTRFEYIECLFKPWTTESDCLVDHLTENTSQGFMTLIDKARGYREFKIEYEKENKIENIGMSKLAVLLKDKGASVSKTLLISMNYALDVLEPAIPETLSRGLGRSQVDKLRRLDQIFKRLAEAHHLYDVETRDNQIGAEYFSLLSDHDGDEWDLNLVIHEFVQRISELLNSVPINRLKYDIEQCMNLDPWKVELISTLPEEVPDPLNEMTEDLDESSTSQIKTANSIGTLASQGSSRLNGFTQPNASTEPVVTPSQSNESQILNDPLAKIVGEELSTEPADDSRMQIPQNMFIAGKVDLKSMRSRVYLLALKFAQATRVHHCLVPWKYGYGYFMDLPKSKLNHIMTMDQESLKHIEYKFVTNKFSKDRNDAQKTFSWWLLWQTQGLLEFNENPVPGYQHMPESMMKNLINQVYDPEETGRYSQMVSGLFQIRLVAGGPTCIMDMAMAYTYITPSNMMKYVNLLEAKTQLMAYTEENGIDLWGSES